jgi:hypothetical protein
MSPAADQARDNLQKIEHFIVLIMENRSFDQMLGYLEFEEFGGHDIDGWSRSVMAAHRTTRSRAIGSSFVGPKNAAISKSDRIAPPTASTLHQLNGTQIPTTARAARKNSTAAVTARKNPERGKPEDAVTWPNGPLSPSLQGQAHLNKPPNVPWASLSRGTRYEAAKWVCNTKSAAKSHLDSVLSPPLDSALPHIPSSSHSKAAILRPHVSREVGCLYSPPFREGVFSETHIPDRETLCVRTGA